MPPKGDQRTREDLDLFLLALIREGVTTPYRMQTAAGISQGASLQSLKRLALRRLIGVSEEGPRRRTEFQLTTAGRRWLDAGCAALAESESAGDLDSVLRKALLIAFSQKDGKKAAQFLRAAAKSRRAAEGGTSDPDPESPEIAQLYSRFRQNRADAVVHAEAGILERAASEMARRRKRKE
jgi:DNA-binding PadR family transcriptional regulator